ncbi:FtsK/SpoIIIE domain-containing protein [Priestia megaterium]|uniref:FtsK/SpoIIIE domain-containing protein n=1 Tax=Priestia megaterium TaxID=1404 RepID=UPI000BF7C3EF|nr:FtsK/SpoIIIE domain-containing protein [Priestia megaterium]PFJ03200.1 cell division protein FtsK [Priestia megaterium]PGR11735.1 cell division protein FtsK [Priestia megaterium]
MIEFLFPAAVCGGAVLFGRKKKSTDRDQIELVFRNLGVGGKVGKEKQTFVFPKMIKDYPVENGHEYIYGTTVGLPDKTLKPLKEVLSSTLNKPMKLKYKKYLTITVYDEPIPELVPYKDAPDKEGWMIPLGKNETGWHFHDFDKTPHMVAAGTTRFGKTQMIKNMMTYLIEHNPDNVEFLIIDLKGKLEFNRYRNLQQVKCVCGDPFEAYEALSELHLNIKDVKEEFLNNDWNNIVKTSKQKRLFVIVDEAAELASDKFMEPEVKKIMSACQYYLSEIARVAGGLGTRLIYCTQYPTSDCLPRQIKMNSDIKMSFRLSTGYASEVAIDETGAEKLPSNIPGRALVKTHEVMEVQTPYIEDKEMMERVGQYVITERKDISPEAGSSITKFGENGLPKS